MAEALRNVKKWQKHPGKSTNDGSTRDRSEKPGNGGDVRDMKSQKGQGIATKSFNWWKIGKKSLKVEETIESSLKERSCRNVPSKGGNCSTHAVCTARWSGTYVASLKQRALS
ncbi:hypothetical protein Taro_036033 [Colocasia esculenta]|uniref:Uncharacterized protein n=1 Tax=Colocasia esculenta TaxID=4460 RepID=A0A843W7C0_COLES|nr:hypothetical protein [Colocasia esculenta]